jgi:S-DNA-T family DNA segregation ATPase FtsK/SpoIIIE
MLVEATGAFLLGGPPGSGISTALTTIAKGLISCDTISAVHVLSDRPTELAKVAGISSVSIGAAAVAQKLQELNMFLEQEPVEQEIHGALLIEGLADFTGSEAEYMLSNVVLLAIRHGWFVLASGDPTALTAAYSLIAPFKAGRRAMFLQFDSNGREADLIQAVFPRVRAIDFPEGRGVYVARGKTSIVQVAMVGESSPSTNR